MANYITTQIMASPEPDAKTVYISVPSYGQLDPQVLVSVTANAAVLTAHKINVILGVKIGDCHVDDMRNDVARVFLESKADYLMAWDADVVAPGDATYRLLQHGKDIVAAIYPYKTDVENYPVRYKDGTFETAEGGLIVVEGVPGGFTMWSRKVIQKLYDAEGDAYEWQNKGDYGNLHVRPIWERVVDTGKKARVSSDIVACQKAEKHGFKVYVDPEIPLGHIGRKTWSGHIGQFLMEKTGANARMAKVAFNSLKGKDPNKDQQGTFDACSQLANAFGNKPWAIDEGMLAVLVEIANRPDINSVLETGSGLSTAAFMAAGLDVVTALEAEPIWGAKTEEFLRQCGIDVSTISPVTYAPLKEYGTGKWYDFETDYPYDMVLIDGPRRDQVDLRARICDILPNIVKKAKVVVLDDVDDIDGGRLTERVESMGFHVTKLRNLRNREFAICEKVNDNQDGNDSGDGEHPKAD